MSSSAPANSSSHRYLAAVILAAGKGKRMNSDLPKVVHPVAGRPMICWVVDAVRQAGVERIVLVIGHGADSVRSIFANQNDIVFVTQEPQMGTGHAVEHARPVFDAEAMNRTDVFVLAGDGPLIRAQTLEKMLQAHRTSRAAATLATSIIPDPTGYGRIVRDEHGRFAQIVEHKDATPAQRQVAEVNPSYYCFQARPLFEMLAKVENNNASREYYLTDVFTLMLAKGMRVEVIDAVPPEDELSINYPQQLAEVDGLLRTRLTSSSSKPLPSSPSKAKRRTEAAR